MTNEIISMKADIMNVVNITVRARIFTIHALFLLFIKKCDIKN